MDVAVVGTGYVGLVTGACLAELGNRVVCMDRDVEKVAYLKSGGIPIFEKGLPELVARNVLAGRLVFTSVLEQALETAEIVVLAIGTPSGAEGSADLSMILGAAEQIGLVMNSSVIIVQKSTCPVGTAKTIADRVRQGLNARGVNIPFEVVVNPEFLREGNAVEDFMKPDRVVIGAEREEAARRVAKLYDVLVPEESMLLMDRQSAEMTKYAANAFLATKISFINEIANLCEVMGADVEAVRRGIGSDNRIGASFLLAGLGYGGSCFPKDVRALLKTGRDNGHSLQILEAVDLVNQRQRMRQVDKIVAHFGSLEDRRLAVWGLAFKPGTDDLREAPAIEIVNYLVHLGADVTAFDPVAMPNSSGVISNQVKYASDALTCLDGAEAVLLLTEWPEFLAVDLDEAGSFMKTRVLFDLRNGFDPNIAASAGFIYYGVGRQLKNSLATVINL